MRLFSGGDRDGDDLAGEEDAPEEDPPRGPGRVSGGDVPGRGHAHVARALHPGWTRESLLP